MVMVVGIDTVLVEVRLVWKFGEKRLKDGVEEMKKDDRGESRKRECRTSAGVTCFIHLFSQLDPSPRLVVLARFNLRSVPLSGLIAAGDLCVDSNMQIMMGWWCLFITRPQI
jgi:hypothetical protein